MSESNQGAGGAGATGGDRGADRPSPGERGRKVLFVIEIAGPKNEQVMFPLDQQIARGRWARKNLVGVSYDERFSGMPDIPGICFMANVSGGKKRVRRFDPLAQEANQRILQRAQKVWANCAGVKCEPERQRVWDNCTDEFVKTFCLWARRVVDMGLAVVAHGAVPTFEEIRRMPGQVRVSHYDSSAAAIKIMPLEKMSFQPPGRDDGDAPREEDIPEPVIESGDDWE